MLRAIFTKPRASDTRGFVARLLSSVRVTLRGDFRKGVTYLGIGGQAKF